MDKKMSAGRSTDSLESLFPGLLVMTFILYASIYSSIDYYDDNNQTFQGFYEN